MISKEKKALLHVGKTQLELTDAEYRHVLKEHTGMTSSADPDFSDADFKKVIDHFKALGFWVKRNWDQGRPRDAGDLPTPDQLRVIEHLWNDLAAYVPGAFSRAFRQGFYGKRLHISPLGPQTRAQANAAIEALKNRVQREMRRAVGMGAKEEE